MGRLGLEPRTVSLRGRCDALFHQRPVVGVEGVEPPPVRDDYGFTDRGDLPDIRLTPDSLTSNYLSASDSLDIENEDSLIDHRADYR